MMVGHYQAVWRHERARAAAVKPHRRRPNASDPLGCRHKTMTLRQLPSGRLSKVHIPSSAQADVIATHITSPVTISPHRYMFGRTPWFAPVAVAISLLTRFGYGTDRSVMTTLNPTGESSFGSPL